MIIFPMRIIIVDDFLWDRRVIVAIVKHVKALCHHSAMGIIQNVAYFISLQYISKFIFWDPVQGTKTKILIRHVKKCLYIAYKE